MRNKSDFTAALNFPAAQGFHLAILPSIRQLAAARVAAAPKKGEEEEEKKEDEWLLWNHGDARLCVCVLRSLTVHSAWAGNQSEPPLSQDIVSKAPQPPCPVCVCACVLVCVKTC